MVYKCSDKKSSDGGVKSKNMLNQELTDQTNYQTI